MADSGNRPERPSTAQRFYGRGPFPCCRQLGIINPKLGPRVKVGWKRGLVGVYFTMSNQEDAYVEPEFSSQVTAARYFHMRCHKVLDHRMIVICGGREKCSKDYLINRSTFSCFGIEWVEHGQGEVWCDGQWFPLRPATLFVYGPGIAYTMRTDPRDTMTKCFLVFAGTEAREMLAQASAQPGTLIQVFNAMELSEIFEGLYREGMRRNHSSQEVAAAYLRLLFVKIKALQVPSEVGNSVRLKTFQRCRQFILSHFLRYATVEELAEDLKLTPAYLCRLFREYGEVSPYQLLVRARMSYALDRLILANGRVKQACFEAGYSDPDHFSRLFKKVHGLPPKELALKVLRQTDHDYRGQVAVTENPAPTV
jgi:AraC-like DNA-binding protein